MEAQTKHKLKAWWTLADALIATALMLGLLWFTLLAVSHGAWDEATFLLIFMIWLRYETRRRWGLDN